ncbi:MAG: NAD(P)/FAD-dependent oxidoreductase [Candidatus Geothermincolia bacterium]
MAENIIVGAGLAGLVAAINLAREGRDVIVLDREARVGGTGLYHPSPEGTPIHQEGIKKYTGIDFSPEAAAPAVVPFQAGRTVAYGEMIAVDMDAISSFMIERGPRSTSLDTYLYNIALDAGVKFEFNHPVLSNDDVAELPPDTIIATGLYFEGFDACRVPYMTSFHFVGRQMIEDTESNHVTVYHGEFTRDYAYTASVNGVQFAHVFQRKPIGKDTLKAFEEQVYISEGIEFKSWNHFTFPVPAASMHNPRLFAGDKILAGTLSGCMESFMFFGMLGAMVSGKIAATAVTDKATAFQEFKTATSSFAAAYMAKKMSNLAPHALQKRVLPYALHHAFDVPGAADTVKRAMPGWKNIA